MQPRDYHSRLFYLNRALIMLSALVIILFLTPDEGKFRYEYLEGKPWRYSDLIAPFDFAIRKSPEEIKNERERVLKQLLPHFRRHPETRKEVKDAVIRRISDLDSPGSVIKDFTNLRELWPQISQVLDTIYNRGLIGVPAGIPELNADSEIMLLEGNTGNVRLSANFFTFRSAMELVNKELKGLNKSIGEDITLIISESLRHDIVYDPMATKKEEERLLAEISTAQGLVQQGERILAKGEIISPQKYMILESLKQESEAYALSGSQRFYAFFAKMLLIALVLLAFYGFLYFFRKDVFDNSNKMLLLFTLIVLMVALVFLLTDLNPEYAYLAPVCLIVIVARFFFDELLALLLLLSTTFLISYWMPGSFTFAFLQIFTGFLTILSLRNFQKRSQFFFTALTIFLAYILIFYSLHLMQEGSISGIDHHYMLYFGANAVLSIFSYPLIYLFEKVFSLQTDISLIEVSNVSNKLLRAFALKAPGSFQHSLQVANLAEAAIHAIGGNAVLVRAGALYHDIGKMINPMYFIENQTTGINPHDELTTEESVHIITGHVMEGIMLARKNNLPEEIIDFIRTHHGTRKTDYFYNKVLKEFPDEKPDQRIFSYRGPVPFSRETAVVMMADSVEAATRSLSDHTEENITRMVDTIINRQVDEEQFSNADITLRDINIIKRVFRNLLMNIYHPRIRYFTT